MEEVLDATALLDVIKPPVVTPTKRRRSDAERLLLSVCKEHAPTCNIGRKTVRQVLRDAGASLGMSKKKVARLTGREQELDSETPLLRKSSISFVQKHHIKHTSCQ